MDLNGRQREFVALYCSNGHNATQAAKGAGYKLPHSQGHRLLNHVVISAAIADFKERAMNRVLVTVEDVVNGLLTEAQCNGEGSTQSARVAAWKALTDYTGGFDNNTQKTDNTHKGLPDTITFVRPKADGDK